MAERKLARRYAYSLLGLAQERDVLDPVYADMALIEDTCEESRELSVFLKNPVINTDKKDAVIRGLFGDKVSEMSLAFMQIITRKKREGYLEEIAREYVSMYKHKKGISIARIITAGKLEDGLRNEVIEYLNRQTGHRIELSETVDAGIVGGYILRWSDQQVDASISRKLRELRMSFRPNLYIKDF